MSKGLGLGIIAGSVLVKVPQILKILSNQSAEGLSLISVFLDLFAVTAVISYSFVSGFPFSAWGDGTFLAIQTAAIVALVLFYGKKSATKAYTFLVLYAIVLYVLMSGLTPLKVLWSAQGVNLPVLLLAKLTQAYTNYKNGGTGQLSAPTCSLLFLGSLARIFTSHQETGDTMMIVTYIISTFGNAIIVFQLIYYWNKDKKLKPKTKAKKTN